MRRTLVTHSRQRVLRVLAPIAALALVGAVSAGCGDDGGDEDVEQVTVTVDQNGETIGIETEGVDDTEDAGTPPFSQEQLDAAVLQSDNFSTTWTSEPGTEEPASTGLGCWSDIDALSESVTEQAKTTVDFSYGDAGLPSVESGVAAYADEAEVTALFDDVQAAVAACPAISGTDADGVVWDVALTSDETPADGVDDQINISGSGTISGQGGSVEVSLFATFARSGANLMTITASDTTDRSSEWPAWQQIALDRFTAVAAGEEPAATTAPDPA